MLMPLCEYEGGCYGSMKSRRMVGGSKGWREKATESKINKNANMESQRLFFSC